jgi:hypothetical protein
MDTDSLLERIGPAVACSDAAISDASCGPLTVPAGLSPWSRKPERGGVLCQCVFGPVVDLCCVCTKLRGEAVRGQRCAKCGVTVLPASARAERFGHVELVTPLRHPWLPEVQIERVLVLPPLLRLAPDERGDPERDPDAYTRAVIAMAQSVTPDSAHERYPETPRPLGTSALYVDLIDRNETFRVMLRHAAPAVIVEHETGLLQASLDALFGPPTTSRNPRGRRLRDLLLLALDRGDEHELGVLRQAAGLVHGSSSEPT